MSKSRLRDLEADLEAVGIFRHFYVNRDRVIVAFEDLSFTVPSTALEILQAAFLKTGERIAILRVSYRNLEGRREPGILVPS